MGTEKERAGKLGLQQPQVDLKNTEEVICPNCGGKVFNQSLMLRKVSPLLTGTGQPGLIPISVFECTKCHEILKEYLPKEFQ